MKFRDPNLTFRCMRAIPQCSRLLSKRLKPVAMTHCHVGASGEAIFLFWLFLAMGTLARANFVAYTLTYNSLDCSGVPGMFQAFNQPTCTPAACTASTTASEQSICYAGTLASLANPIVCPGCAYCGSVEYPSATNCMGANNWTTAVFKRLGTCIATGANWLIAYGCTAKGAITNFTQYNDQACTQPCTTCTIFDNPPFCQQNQPQCQANVIPDLVEDYCSYDGLFSGGGGGGGNNGSKTVASARTASLVLLAVLVWATL
jgi:hypothetical protein